MGVSIRAHAPLRHASVRSRVRSRASATAPGGRLAPWLDLLIALALFIGGSVHEHRAGVLGIALRLAIVAPLLLRRRAPVAVFSLIWTLAAVQGLLERPSFADAALLVAFYTLASARDLRATLAAGAVLELGIVLAVSWETHGAQRWANALVALSGLALAAGVLGVNVQNRRRTLSDLRDRAEHLERERERELALARVTERSRIAREMHDVVAHNLSVMVALCDGAGYHVHGAPERAASALQQASRTGRQALTEMRQLLGVLREPESPEPLADAAGTAGLRAAQLPELAPQPGIGRVDELVARVRDAGLPVTWTLVGEPRGVPPGLELAVYRIVQEALTNTIKHAGTG
ncbi:MAG: sensor histidine kinase, partial [Solirubrobacteraceae bacterium]